MRAIRCAIVDDEPLAVRLIENFIKRTPSLEHVVSFTDPVEAVTYLKENAVDLLFLDIQMPDIDGIGLAHMLPEGIRIVFTTAFREYALESYDVEALDFLVKPLRYDKFLRSAEKAMKWYEMKELSGSVNMGTMTVSPKEIFLRCDGGLQRVAFDSIVFVEGLKDYVRFHRDGINHTVVTHLTMKSVEDILPSEQFMRVSRSHIISLSHIRSVDRNLCVYIGDTMVKVTDMYREHFQAFLNNRLVGR